MPIDRLDAKVGLENATTKAVHLALPRRWPWFVLAAAVVVFGPPLLWMHRPLNQEEKRLVGSWVLLPHADAERPIYMFQADRTFTFTPSPNDNPRFRRLVDSGWWEHSEGRYLLHRDAAPLPGRATWPIIKYRILRFLQGAPRDPKPISVTFEADDTIRVRDLTWARQEHREIATSRQR